MNTRHRLIERELNRDGEAIGAYLVMVTKLVGQFLQLKIIQRDELDEHISAGWSKVTA